MLKMISPGGKSNGIVYVPARQGFVSSSSAAATASGGPPVDLFFDLQELRVSAVRARKRALGSRWAGFSVDMLRPLWRMWCLPLV